MKDAFRFTYTDARDAFLSRAQTCGAQLAAHVHPLAGPDGPIATDVAVWGLPDAAHTLVISSGTHGIEGYCGSGVQCTLLDEGFSRELPATTRLIMIHAVNPHGFAWKRRVNEDNIDLNRNFLDHDNPPVNEAYRELAPLLDPDQWHAEAARDAMRQCVERARAHADRRWMHAALAGGQYEFPGGQFYGGARASWSNQTIHKIAHQWLHPGSGTGGGRPLSVTWIDVHTALGEFGQAECIVECPTDTSEFARCKALWGDRVRSTQEGESLSVPVQGSMITGMRAVIGDSLIGTGLEYGTVHSREVIPALLADQWLTRYGNVESPEGAAIKQRMMDVFYPDSDEWRSSVTAIAGEVTRAALVGPSG